MGFKIAALTAPAEDRTLETFVETVLGRTVGLQSTGLTTEQILLEQDTYACGIDGQHWLFDWALIGDWIESPPTHSFPCAAFMLQSTVNAYGFSVYDGAQILRRRVGDESGIHIDEGPLLHAEQEALVTLAPAGNVTDALSAWADANKTFDGEWEDMNHDSMGEEVVFAMMKSIVGFSIDQESDQQRRFCSATVQKVSTQNKSFLAKIFSR